MVRIGRCGRLPCNVVREAIGFIGRALITVGILVLLFVGYQLWGTSWFEARAQDDLTAEFEAKLAAAPSTTAAPDPAVTTPPVVTQPLTGEAVAIIRIPKIGVDRTVVSGIGRDDLRKGPGHYPNTPMPGQIGNAAIAGHRTTYGAPFFDLAELMEGDEINVQTITGEYTYRVVRSFVVNPNQVEVLAPTSTPTLTLTTCEPKYSAAKRLIVQAELVPEQSAAPTEPVISDTTAESVSLDEEGLSGDPGEIGPVLLWLGILALVGAAWWLLFHRYHRIWTWLVGVVPFALVLFVFYSHLERMLPANY